MRRKAFLTEDDPAMRELLTALLDERAGVDVVGAASEATRASIWLLDRRNTWDLALVDLFLKEGNGLTVLAGCRVRKSNQRVVVLSNYATPDMRRRCAFYGADAIFDKTTELEQLIAYCKSLGSASP